jgi:hypothetical protein
MLHAGENGFLAFFKLILIRNLLLRPKSHLIALLQGLGRLCFASETLIEVKRAAHRASLFLLIRQGPGRSTRHS